MDLIVISNPFAVVDESTIINNLFHAGLTCFHLRKPESDMQTLRELLKEIKPCFYNRIALHQFHEMAVEFDISRLHYTESARQISSLEQLQAQAENGFILSTSVHNIDVQLPVFDYVFFGPVFNSISKPGYLGKLPADFKLNRDSAANKVIALGGVKISNLVQIKKMGFDGAAVLGAVWNEPGKVVAHFNQLQETCLL